MVKRFYHLIAWLALANLFAVGGLVGYLTLSGRLNRERIEQIAVVLRGEFPKPQVVTSQPAVKEVKPETSREELTRMEAKKRFYELISDRSQRELQDRNALNQSIQMDVDRQLEQVQAKSKEFEQVRKETQQAMSQDGFQQTLDIYSDMEPKLAKDVLMGRKEVDVVQVFMKLDANRRKKIINACKTPEETAWVSRVLAQMLALDAQVPAAAQPKGPVAAAGKNAAAQ